MFEEVSDLLLSDVSSPTPDDLVHPTNESIQLNQKMLELLLALSGENKPDPWDNVAELSQGMTWQQVEEHFACRHSVNMLPEPEPEKEKALERKGIWSEKEKGLFRSGLAKFGWSHWKDISGHIRTRSSEQVRSYSKRNQHLRPRIQDIQSLPPETSRPIANPGHLPVPRTVYAPIMEPMVRASNVLTPIRWDLAFLRPEHGLHYNYIYGNFGGCLPAVMEFEGHSTSTLSSDSCGYLAGPSAYGYNMYPGQ